MSVPIPPATIAPHGQPPSLRVAIGQMLRLARLLRPHWRSLASGSGLGLVIGLVSMAAPYLSKLFIDVAYPTHDTTFSGVLVIGLLTITLTGTVLGGLRQYYTQVVAARIGGATMLLFFNHVQHLSSRFFDQHRVGEVLSRFSDVRSSLTALSRTIETIVTSTVYLLLVPPLLLLLNWRRALLAVGTVPVTTAIATTTSRMLRRLLLRSAEAQAEFSAYQVEVLTNVRTLKSMAGEHRNYVRAREQLEGAMGYQLRAGAMSSIVAIGNGTIRALGTALFTWYAWHLMLARQMTLGDYVAFTAYLGYFTGPVGQMAGLFGSFQQSSVMMTRMFEYLDLEPEQDPARAAAPPPPVERVLTGAVEFRGIHFGYQPDVPILSNVSLQAPAGSVLALVGRSGAGKSSLLRVLARLEHPTRGDVLVDGESIRDMPLVDLRRQLAIVWQDVSLMRGSIRDNVTAGIIAASDDEIEEALRLCRLDEFVAGLPDGLDTPVAEWGATLSGGQRQRLAIARALVRRTPIILLDEATANVDVETEAEMLRGIFAARREATIIFVTHRLALAKLADAICVLEDGGVVGFGSHTDLMATCDSYRRMQQAAGEDTRRLRVVGEGA